MTAVGLRRRLPRPTNGVLAFLAGVGMLLLFAYAMCGASPSSA